MYDSKALKQFEERLAELARSHVRLQIRAASDGAGTGPAPAGLASHVEKQLRRERMKARSGHAAYDFNRHLALLQLARQLSPRGRTPASEKEKAGC